MASQFQTNPDDLAFPTFEKDGSSVNMGLTKRELFSAKAMQGMVADPTRTGTERETAEAAVKLADALVAALNK